MTEWRKNNAFEVRRKAYEDKYAGDEPVKKKDEETGEEVAVPKKSTSKPISKEDAQHLQYKAIVAEGRALYRAKEYRRAITSFTEAMEKSKDDPSILIDRANCYIQVGQPEDALRDVDAVLRDAPANPEAILTKAEAYFSMGEFEFALVFFQRGLAVRKDMVAFKDGITKCKSAILDSINGVPLFKANPNFAMSRPREPLFPVPEESKEPKPEDPEKRQKTAALLPEKVEPLHGTEQRKEFLGELALDYDYLLELREEVKNSISSEGQGKKEDEQIGKVVEDALVYLDQRSDFWAQQGGRSKDETGEGTGGGSPQGKPTRASKTSPAKNPKEAKAAHYQMSKIQQYEAKYGQGAAKSTSQQSGTLEDDGDDDQEYEADE